MEGPGGGGFLEHLLAVKELCHNSKVKATIVRLSQCRYRCRLAPLVTHAADTAPLHAAGSRTIIRRSTRCLSPIVRKPSGSSALWTRRGTQTRRTRCAQRESNSQSPDPQRPCVAAPSHVDQEIRRSHLAGHHRCMSVARKPRATSSTATPESRSAAARMTWTRRRPQRTCRVLRRCWRSARTPRCAGSELLPSTSRDLCFCGLAQQHSAVQYLYLPRNVRVQRAQGAI